MPGSATWGQTPPGGARPRLAQTPIGARPRLAPPDLVVYPDSGKLGALERLLDRAGLFEVFRLADAVEYHDGERPPSPPS